MKSEKVGSWKRRLWKLYGARTWIEFPSLEAMFKWADAEQGKNETVIVKWTHLHGEADELRKHGVRLNEKDLHRNCEPRIAVFRRGA